MTTPKDAARRADRGDTAIPATALPNGITKAAMEAEINASLTQPLTAPRVPTGHRPLRTGRSARDQASHRLRSASRVIGRSLTSTVTDKYASHNATRPGSRDPLGQTPNGPGTRSGKACRNRRFRLHAPGPSAATWPPTSRTKGMKAASQSRGYFPKKLLTCRAPLRNRTVDLLLTMEIRHLSKQERRERMCHLAAKIVRASVRRCSQLSGGCPPNCPHLGVACRYG